MTASVSVWNGRVVPFTFDPKNDQINAAADGITHIIINAEEAAIWRDSLTRCLVQRELHLEAMAAAEPVAEAHEQEPLQEGVKEF